MPEPEFFSNEHETLQNINKPIISLFRIVRIDSKKLMVSFSLEARFINIKPISLFGIVTTIQKKKLIVAISLKQDIINIVRNPSMKKKIN